MIDIWQVLFNDINDMEIGVPSIWQVMNTETSWKYVNTDLLWNKYNNKWHGYIIRDHLKKVEFQLNCFQFANYQVECTE